MNGSGLFAWLRAHPAAAAGRIAWIVLNGLLAAGGAIIFIWGPLMAQIGVAVVIGACVGTLMAMAWTHQQGASIQGQREIAQRWRTNLSVGAIVVIVVWAALAAVQMAQIGAVPPLGGGRVAHLDRLWRAISRNYPYLAEKGVDWPALRRTYLAQAQFVQTDQEYASLIARMLAELQDGHTQVTRPAPTRECCLAVVQDIEGLPVVTYAGPEAQSVGLQKGAVLLTVDGKGVEQALADLPPELRSGSTPQQRRLAATTNLLALPPQGRVEVTFRTPAGERRTAILARSGSPSPAGQAPSPTVPVVTSMRLPSGWGLIRIPTLGERRGQHLVAEFDAALDGLMDAPGLILDLRGNGGGNSSLADAMAGRLLSQRTVYGQESYRTPLPLRAWRRTLTFSVQPRGRIYTAPLVLLINAGDASSAEMLITALVDSGRAQTVGRTTGGASGNPIRFQVGQGIEVRFSTGAFRRNNGQLIEGRGIIPDLPVAWTLEDVLQERDPDVTTAEGLLSASPAERAATLALGNWFAGNPAGAARYGLPPLTDATLGALAPAGGLLKAASWQIRVLRSAEHAAGLRVRLNQVVCELDGKPYEMRGAWEFELSMSEDEKGWRIVHVEPIGVVAP